MYTAYHRQGDGVEATKRLYAKLPEYKKKQEKFQLESVKKELQEQAVEAKRKDMNLDVENWK